MINVGKKMVGVMSVLLLFLSFSLGAPQDPPKKSKKQKKQEEHLQVVPDTSVAVRNIDTLYLEQLSRSMKLDSLIEEQKKKL